MNKIEQNWATYFSRVDSKPASFRLNLALKNVAPIQDYKFRTCFSVLLLQPDENGFTTNEEFPKICQIEDDICDALLTQDAILAGFLKNDGTFDIYLYSKNTDNYKEIIRDVMQNHSDYKYAINTIEDAEWSDYFDFLYPAPYEYQTIINQKVLMSLEKNGNNPELDREVDHWIYFNTDSDREQFIAEVIDLGYSIKSKDDKDANTYQLHISRMDNTIRNNVNNYVWELVKLADKYKGDYDGWGCNIAN